MLYEGEFFFRNGVCRDVVLRAHGTRGIVGMFCCCFVLLCHVPMVCCGNLGIPRVSTGRVSLRDTGMVGMIAVVLVTLIIIERHL